VVLVFSDERPPWLPLFAKLFAALSGMVLIVCIVFFEVHRKNHLSQVEATESRVVAAQVATMIDALHRVRADLVILSHQSELATARPGSPALAALAQEYAEFAHAVGLYEAIRLLDASGRELISVADHDGEINYRILGTPGPFSPRERAAVLSMVPGGMLMFVHNHIDATTYRPLLRFATSVAVSGRVPTHIVEITYRADVLLDQMAQIGARSTNTLIVSDGVSLWTTHPRESALTWGFTHAHIDEAALPKRYPTAWARIQSEENGTIRLADAVFVFRTAHPAVKGFWGLRGETSILAPEASDWKIVSFLSPEALKAMRVDILRALMPVAFSLVLAAGLGSWIFAWLWAERRRRHSRLLQRATTDPLTGALNRAAFTEHLSAAAARYAETGEGYALIYADLDDFKEINDLYGHGAGDARLRETVARLRACIRDSDAVGRLGGDEFAVLLSSCKSRTAAAAVLNKIAQSMEAPSKDDPPGPISVSLGLAVCPDDGKTAELLLRIADQDMYGAKRNQRTQPDPPVPPVRS